MSNDSKVGKDRLIIKRRGDDGYKVFSVRVRDDILERIEKLAAESGRSRNEMIGMLLEFAIERCEIE